MAPGGAAASGHRANAGGGQPALIKRFNNRVAARVALSGSRSCACIRTRLTARVEEMLGAYASGLHGWRLRGDPTLHHGGVKSLPMRAIRWTPASLLLLARYARGAGVL